MSSNTALKNARTAKPLRTHGELTATFSFAQTSWAVCVHRVVFIV
jgi:hypothetical protein